MSVRLTFLRVKVTRWLLSEYRAILRMRKMRARRTSRKKLMSTWKPWINIL